MLPYQKLTVPYLLACSLLLPCCSDDSAGPTPDAPRGDGSQLDVSRPGDGAPRQDAGALSCAELEQVYLSTLELARVCEPRSIINPCTAQASNRISCGCNTSVNIEKTTEIAKLQSLKVSWERKQCQSGPCPGRPCAQLEGGVCAPTPRNSKVPGLCEDLLP